MKKLITTFVLVLFVLQLFSQNAEIQKTYVNLDNSVLNPKDKPCWNKKDISDEFDLVDISNPYSGPYNGNPNLDMVNGNWHWCPSWAMAHYNSPYYCKKDNIETTVYSEPDANNYIKLWTKYEPDGFEHPDLAYYNSPRYPVLKNYSSVELNSYPLSVKLDPETFETFPANGKFKYGYFEIRCRLPKGKFLWPAFWLFTGNQDPPAIWNEIDIFESGINDQMLLSNHFRSNGTHYASGKWVYALPGQSFSNTWVTYALKWESNKLIWYINNKPVKIIKDIDYYTDPEGNTVQVIIPQTEMHVIAGIYTVGQRGAGITSCDANYNIIPYCSLLMLPCPEDALIPNTFKNLHYAIYASNTNPAIPVTINGNEFIDNFRSITLRGIDNATVTENDLKFNTFFC